MADEAPVTRVPEAPVTRSAPTRPIYGRLELVSEVHGANGAHGTEVIVFRPTARAMAQCIDAISPTESLSRFVASCCRITNGTGAEHPFSADELYSADGMTLARIMIGFQAEVANVKVDGDGINEPIVYNLQHPIYLNPQDPDAPIIRQLEFKARRIGEISEFLDARGAEERFNAFMRGFGLMLGTQLPMSDGIIGAIDVVDFSVIMYHIIPLFSDSGDRWRKA